MIREKQIEEAAERYFNGTCSYRDREKQSAFIQGAKWALRQPPWISVDEKLPPYGVDVYVYSTFYFSFGEWKTKRYQESGQGNGIYLTLDEYGFK